MERNNSYGAARERECNMMKILADVVAGDFGVPEAMQADDLRQLGYAAQVVRGSVDDPEKRLTHLVKLCRAAVAEAPMVEIVDARDTVQAQWGAPWHVDARKFRRELPLHLTWVRVPRALA